MIAAKNVYTSLEQGAKNSPQSRQWFGKRKNERKTDPLLQYLYQARNDDEHGLGEVTKLKPGYLAIGRGREGFSSNISISFTTDAEGRPTIHDLKSKDGLPVLIEQVPAHSRLLPVIGLGNIIYDPPMRHLGKDLSDNMPITVGKLAIDYLARLVDEAEERAT